MLTTIKTHFNRKHILILVITLLSLQVGFSQTIDTLKLNNYFEALESNDKFMGSVALLKNGEIIYTKQIGYADIQTNKKPNQNTKYRIGSISKTFTATLVLKSRWGLLILQPVIIAS